MPAGYDAEVAELFRDLRAATALSEMDLAARLGTRADVVQALEQGALYALPPWAETCRVVNAYGALLNLDVRPLLRRIYAQLEAGIVELQPKAMPDVPVMTPPENGDFGFASGNAGAAAPAKSTRHSLAAAGMPQRQQPQPPPPQPWQNAGRAQPQPRRKRHGRMPAISLTGKMPGPRRTLAASSARLARRATAASGPSTRRLSAAGRPRRSRRPIAARLAAPRASRLSAAAAPVPASAAQPPRSSAPPQPEPMPVDAEFGVPEAALPEPEPKPKRRRPRAVEMGLSAPSLSRWWHSACGSRSAMRPARRGCNLRAAARLDPDDPRSRKADRLPDASQPAPPAQ